MSDVSKIEWCDATWNPVTGCTKVSAGCKHCYAEGVANRFWKGRKFTDVRTHPERLDAPLRWRKPRRVFVNSMSDLFHEDVPDWFVALVFAYMGLAQKHTFQVLTKRPKRMREFMAASEDEVYDARRDVAHTIESTWSRAELLTCYARTAEECERSETWPPPNVWLGVSAEDQATADERIPILLDTPAAVRFVSCEPLLGPIDLRLDDDGVETGGPAGWQPGETLDWVIVGGESGPRARPCDVEWIRDIVAQCRAASVACFVKQLGSNSQSVNWHIDYPNGIPTGKGGNVEQWPEDLRVREFPRKGE